MMVVLYAPIAQSERTPRKCDCRIASRGPAPCSMTRILCRTAAWCPVMALAERAGLPELLAEHVRPGGGCGVNAPLKVGCLVAGMAAGADSVDDMGLLRHGAMDDAVRRGPRPVHARVAPALLHLGKRAADGEGRPGAAGPARRREAPLLPGADVLAFVDIDSTQKRVYGHKKEGASFGHTKIQGKSVLVRGLNALVAAVSTPLAAPVAAATRLRGGNAPSSRGAAGLAAQAVGTARACGATGTIVVRMDSAYYTAAVIAAVRRNGARFSVTAPVTAAIRAAIAAIPEDAWHGDRLPAGHLGRPARLLGLRRRGRRDPLHRLHLEEESPARHRPAHRPPRPRQEPEGGARPGRAVPRLALPRRLHRQPYELLQAEEQHRGHAIIEQLLADLNDGPWPTCHQASSTPTPPGWPSPPSPTTSCAPPAPWPAAVTRKPGPPPSAAT